jgi:hypothetical protein
MHVVRRTVVLAALPLVALLAACKGKEDQPAGAGGMTIGHLFRDSASGLMLDLPANWRGRYRVADGVKRPTEGLQREFALRFVRSDSSEAAQAPMLVARVFDKGAWAALPNDSVRGQFGERVAEDATHTIVVRRAGENPFGTGTTDALAYDSLMMALFSRPLRATMRTP